MASYPEGWYEDPDRFGMERYWDGARWTNDRRSVTTLDVALPWGRKTERRLVVSDEHLIWGDKSIRWDEVTEFNAQTKTENEQPVLYMVDVKDNDRKLLWHYPLNGRNDELATRAFATILDHAERIVVPRILTELFNRGEAGETIEYEKVTLSPQGFAKRRKDPIPWAEYGGWRFFPSGTFHIERMKGDQAKKAVSVSTTQLERWILIALLDDYSRRYSNPSEP